MCFSLALGCRSCPRPWSAARARARPGAMARPPTARATIPGASIPPPQSRTEALRQSTQSDPHASAIAVVEAVCGRPVRAATPRCSGGSWPRSTVLHRPGYSAPPPSPGVRGSAVMDVEPSVGRSRPAVPCGPTGANQRPGGRSNPILTSRGSLPDGAPTVPPASDACAPGPVVSSDNRIAVMCHESPRFVETTSARPAGGKK